MTKADGSFLKRQRRCARNQCDPNHRDHFADIRVGARTRFAISSRLPFYGFAVMCTDHPGADPRWQDREDRRIITTAKNPQADARLVIFVTTGGLLEIQLVFRNRKTDATHEI